MTSDLVGGLSSPRHAASGHRIIASERFAGGPWLSGIVLPLDPATLAGGCLDVVIAHPGGDWRRVSLPPAALAASGGASRISFPAFTDPHPAMFDLVVACRADGVATRLLRAAAASLGPRPPITLACNASPPQPTTPQPDFDMAIEWFWTDRDGLFLRGWMHAFGTPIHLATIDAGRGPAGVVLHTSRPDVAAICQRWNVGADCGFHAYAPWKPGSSIDLSVQTAAGMVRRTLDIPTHMPNPAATVEVETRSNALLSRFAREVNDGRLVVAEIGGRQVSRGWIDNRAIMAGAARYIGMDIHPGIGVDVVGDAHAIDTVLGRGSLDAAFSLSVLEHLARPWQFAASLNRVLRPGGLTLHVTHQSWPLHEEPNDFWRYSDEALRVLFGPGFGFEVIEAGMADKVAIHPHVQQEAHWLMPLVSAYGASFVLARKVRDMEGGPAVPQDAADQAARYPVRDTTSDPYLGS